MLQIDQISGIIYSELFSFFVCFYYKSILCRKQPLLSSLFLAKDFLIKCKRRLLLDISIHWNHRLDLYS